jgi:hypothetical protein
MAEKYPDILYLDQWQDWQQYYLEELDMTVGQSWSALKKNWYSYKIAKGSADVDKMEECAGIIQRLQRGMGLDVASFYYITPKDPDPEL